VESRCLQTWRCISRRSTQHLPVSFDPVRLQPFHEQQVGDLLDGGERVADATTPEFVPELVDFIFEFGVVL
jgi:hypothetical protein